MQKLVENSFYTQVMNRTLMDDSQEVSITYLIFYKHYFISCSQLGDAPYTHVQCRA